MKLQAHNIKGYQEAKELLNKDNRAAIVQATGTGKSYIIMQFLADYHNQEKVIIAPSSDILNQFRENEYWTGHKIKLITYQKLMHMGKEGQITHGTFGDLKLIVVDELHRAGAITWGDALKQLISIYPDIKVLGATATPVRFLDNNRDMVEELFHGNYAGNLSITDAIMSGILPAPNYITSLYSVSDEITKRIKRAKAFKDTNGTDLTNKIISQLKSIQLEWEKTYGVDTIIKKYTSTLAERDNGLKVIVFCTNIDRAEAFKPEIYGWFKKAYPDRQINVYSYHSKAIRYNDQYKAFKEYKMDGSINVLIAVSKLNEGIHIKDVSTVIMLRKTMSNIIYFQQIGRVLSVGTSNQPIVMDLVNNCYAVGKEFAFWKKIASDIQGKKKEYKDRSNNMMIEIHDIIKPVLDLFESIDKLISTPIEVRMEAVRRAIDSGEDINNLSDPGLQAFVRKTISYTKQPELMAKLTNSKQFIEQLIELGATTYMNKPWSKDEDTLILKHYKKISLGELQKLLPDRSIKAIMARKHIINPAKFTRWTGAEIEILKQYYPTEGDKVANRLTNRDKRSIQVKAKLLNISRKDTMSWSAEEEKILKQYYPMEGSEVIKRLPNRSTASIANRASKLNLKRDSLWSKEEDGILRQYYPTEGTKVHLRLKNRSVAAVRGRASALGAHTGRNDSWTKEEDEILLAYYAQEGSKTALRIPGRTESAVKTRANNMGLKIIGVSWTEEEETILKQYYPTLGTKVAGYILNKTKSAIKRRASILGIKFMGTEA